MKTPQDIYVESIVTKHAPRVVLQTTVDPICAVVTAWANKYLLEYKFSGSYMKSTAVAGSADIDILVSLSRDVLIGNTPNLSSLYHSLSRYLVAAGYPTRLQNVSIGLEKDGVRIDLVPAVKHPGNTNDHSLYKRKADTWTKTNVDIHINTVRSSGRTGDIKAIKIWRNLHRLDISSFYLELAVLEALSGKPLYDPAANFMHVLDFFSNKFVGRSFYDPANTANLISDELSPAEQTAIKNQAISSRLKPIWEQIIW